MFGAGTTSGGMAVAFGPLGGPADSWILRDSAGQINLTCVISLYTKIMGGNGAQIGNTATFASVGNLGTANAYVQAGGTGGSADLLLRPQIATRQVQAQGHLTASNFSGTIGARSPSRLAPAPPR